MSQMLSGSLWPSTWHYNMCTSMKTPPQLRVLVHLPDRGPVFFEEYDCHVAKATKNTFFTLHDGAVNKEASVIKQKTAL